MVKSAASFAFFAVLLLVLLRFLVCLYYHTTEGECDNTGDLTGKCIAVTGAASGIGAEVVRQLYTRNASVLMLVRDIEKAIQVQGNIENSFQKSNGSLTIIHCDLTDLESVKKCGRTILRYVDRLDALINNAGIGANTCRTITADGIEEVMQANFFGHFVLTILLLPMIKTSQGTVVNVSSFVYSHASVDSLEDISYRYGEYSGYQAYARSKLLINLITKQLAVEFYNEGAKFYAVNPGIVATPIGDYFIKNMFGSQCPRWWLAVCHFFYGIISKSTEQASRLILSLTLDDNWKVFNGSYVDCWKVTYDPVLEEFENSEKAWIKVLDALKIDGTRRSISEDIGKLPNPVEESFMFEEDSIIIKQKVFNGLHRESIPIIYYEEDADKPKKKVAMLRAIRNVFRPKSFRVKTT